MPGTTMMLVVMRQVGPIMISGREEIFWFGMHSEESQVLQGLALERRYPC